MTKDTSNGAKVYTPLTLKLYDWWVLSVSNRYAWKCSTSDHLQPHFVRNLSKKHLDIGVGTGYYLTHAPDTCALSLLDLNPASLQAASARAGSTRIKNKISHDVFTPYPDALHGQFDSVSMFYLLHCLPGSMADKSTVVQHAAESLSQDGVLYGATILGEGVEHNGFGQKLMNVYNHKGIFSNRNDSEAALRQILTAHFRQVDVTVKGTVALFSASGKR